MFFVKKTLDNNYHIDHKIALCRDGTHTIDNIQILCPTCNLRKRTRTNEEFFKVLKKELINK